MLAHGSRLTAAVAEARALALRRRNPYDAAECASRAYAIFAQLRFAWRAARMATLLHQVSRARRWHQRALEHLSQYPPGAFPLLTTFSVLTQRESEVLALLRARYHVPAIARRLRIGKGTVRSHVQSIHRKLGPRHLASSLAEDAAEYPA
jgi:DNA-binding NarL/FixJ family response regulator